jgi:hypothetical protein
MPKRTLSVATREEKRRRFMAIRNNDGPKRRLTVRVFIRICKSIEKGTPIYKACEAQGVTFALFRMRVSQSPRLQERVKKAEAVRAAWRFEKACGSIIDAGDQSWMAHAWWLERSHPQLFALRTVHRIDAEATQAEPELPAQILEQHRRLMLETFSETERESEHSTK